MHSQSGTRVHLGERGLLLIAGFGCLGAYVTALTLALRAFLPLAVSLGIAVAAIAAIEYALLHLRRRSARAAQSVGLTLTARPLPIEELDRAA